MKHYFLYILTAFLLISCGNEDPISSIQEQKDAFESHRLPQGNHPYDAAIQSIFAQTGTLVLYKYQPSEFDWGVTRNYLWTKERMADEGYLYQLPDEKYVGEQVKMLQTEFLNLFPSSFLKKHLPLRILLCSELYYLEGGYTTEPTHDDYKPVNAFEGYEFFAVNHGNSAIEKMTRQEKDAFRIDLCKLLLRRIYPTINRGALREAIPEAFVAISTYGTDVDGSLDAGFIDDRHKNSVREDWYDYLQTIVSTPASELQTNNGLLSHNKVKQKYEVVINYFKNNFKVDLQRIGDMATAQ